MFEGPFEGLPVPTGHRVMLPGRGTTFVREAPGPPGAPTVVLLHGWVASAGINWFQVFAPLSQHYRVLAPDLRGHGRGIRSRRRFTIEDNAADVDTLLEVLGVDEAIVVGYSMGGPVAQMLWRNHPERVAGLVLAATGAEFVRAHERMALLAATGLAAAAVRAGNLTRFLPTTLARQLTEAERGGRATNMVDWARAEMGRHSMQMVAEAGVAVANFDAKRWVHEIDVPTSVFLTLDDNAVLPDAQLALADAIPDASVHHYEGGHIACVQETFGPAIVSAIRHVERRVSAASPGAAPATGRP